MPKRLKELDFLRGLAILLVLLRHQYVSVYTTTMGWIGVDLFFVLSGFLVSGLLFSEYKKNNTIDAKRFLIRRGFKIYPVYYITYVLYLIPLLLAGTPDWVGIFSDLVFIQNYVLGWGYAYGASWSLAVEEHFYIMLCIFLWWVIKKKPYLLEKKAAHNISGFEVIVLSIMALCLLFRVLQSVVFPMQEQTLLLTMTHTRIDSLLAGVLISYFYYFKTMQLRTWFKKYKYVLLKIALLGLSWTPFYEVNNFFFAKTIGLTSVYIACGILLLYFLHTDNIVSKLNMVFTHKVTNWISKIGYSSYSIYVIHILVINLVTQYAETLDYKAPTVVLFTVILLLSVFAGMIITNTIERYFLNIRDRYFPRIKTAHTGSHAKPAPKETSVNPDFDITALKGSTA